MFYQRKRKNSNDDNNDNNDIDSENIVVKYCYSRATAEEEDISNDEHQYHGRYRYGGEKGDEAGDGGERTNSNPSNSALERNRRSEEADTIYNNESTPPRKLC